VRLRPSSKTVRISLYASFNFSRLKDFSAQVHAEDHMHFPQFLNLAIRWTLGGGNASNI
jgi:hypothetical protein